MCQAAGELASSTVAGPPLNPNLEINTLGRTATKTHVFTFKKIEAPGVVQFGRYQALLHMLGSIQLAAPQRRIVRGLGRQNIAR